MAARLNEKGEGAMPGPENMYIESNIIAPNKEAIKKIFADQSSLNPNPREDLNKKFKKIKKEKKRKPGIDGIIQELADERIKKPEDIQNFIKTNHKLEVSDAQANFYSELLKSSIYNIKLNLASLLNNRNFYYYLGSNDFLNISNVFTNDRLYWLSIICLRLQQKKLISFLKLSSKSVSLQTLCVDQKNGYRKGYVQDYEEDFSCIGLDSLTPEQIKSLQNAQYINNATKYTFNYDGKDYSSLMFASGCIITFLSAKVNEVPDKIKKVRILGDRKNLNEGIKLYTLKKSKGIYISQNVSTTDFFPCEVIVENPLRYSYLVKFDVDMLAYENYLMTNFTYNNNTGLDSFLKFPNLIQWNTFDLLINFLIAEKMTTYKEDVKYEDLRKKIDELLKEYTRIKSKFREVGQVCEKTVFLVTKFFGSFTTNISYNKVTKFEEPISKCLNNFRMREKENAFIDVENLLNNFGLKQTCITIYNSVKANGAVIKILLERIDDYIKNFKIYNIPNLMTETKNIGILIFNIFNIYGNENIITNEIVTPTLFLGNLLNNNYDTIDESILNMTETNIKLLNKSEKDIKDIITMNKLGLSRGIKRIIALYFKKMKTIKKFTTKGGETELPPDVEAWFNENELDDDDVVMGNNSYQKMAASGLKAIIDDIKTFDEAMVDSSTVEKL